ncbi:LmeA family phospholipid-binding protein [Anabaena subtropica]|uniref:DUF2993 domain-containing protein n=1 Tax=Anabaena subtropica FACHB-260 TaxID=2692884 RepID=A0ABR8CKP6_9NOST|nr:DUF2993 domain-containing protein [Anabaena subtropica]MBD2342672.1 DUF2993 domain-containing protein [Anabaena subtropica FACHB-260]
MPDKQNLEEHLISQVAERSIFNQLDTAEQIDIYVQTDILKVVQGQADGVTVAGQGLVTKQNIRVQEIQVKTDSIAINPLSAIFGDIQLDKPVNLAARVILSEADINSALTSDFTRKLMQNFDLDVDGEIVNFEMEHIQIFLPSNYQMGFRGNLLLKQKNNSQLLGFTAMIRPRTASQPIMLESFHCTQGKGVSLELVTSLMQKAKYLVNLPYFVWEDMKICIKNMEMRQGILILSLEVNVMQIPESVIGNNNSQH